MVAYKKASGKPILDTKREEVIFEKVGSRVEDKRYQETIVATFSDILKRSRDYQDQNIK
ncbi:putative chorismate mutase [Streptococcus pneumoniae PNI0076]|nr:chorismate mutase type II family protein [Streptococcus pneumoniae 2070335]ELU82408.1 putative chorismate mutase [Streptococcus pneumoniae PNI0076]VIY46990.1 chorismate mutase/prephenate dehydratase [Streptococcus pneumoniae]VJM53899.1 chorismate mutase/prephenate dehydratase [Streptococcus pneumoniae]VKL34224.1 chorismate mutase/prephenate dehydratase [Streptococcus pneumoniae]